MKFLPAILLAIAALRGQDAPKSICGTDNQTPAANLQLIQVSCIDFDRLRAQAPSHPWPVGKVTQVLVHVRDGDMVRVTVGDRVQHAELIRDAWGRLIALVQFDGVDYKAVAVKVYRAVEEKARWYLDRALAALDK